MMQDKDDDSALLKTLLDLEHRVWLALTTGDAAQDKALLSPDFLGVYASGFATRDAHVAQLSDGPSVGAYQLSEVQARPVGAEHALLSYRAEYQRKGVAASEVMYVSSLWHRMPDGDWFNIFSQDTPATD